MVWVLGVLALVLLAFLVVGAATGRVSLTSCCAEGGATGDLRKRAVFEDTPESAKDDGAKIGPVPNH